MQLSKEPHCSRVTKKEGESFGELAVGDTVAGGEPRWQDRVEVCRDEERKGRLGNCEVLERRDDRKL